MCEKYWFMFLGHLLGDYFFQNNWMALNKKKPTSEGYYACLFHCFIYTVIVSLCLLITNYQVSLVQFWLIFFSHWIFDRYELIEKYANFVGIRIWNSKIDLNHLDVPFTKEESIHLSFGVFVYIVMDNTAHLFLMTLIIMT